MDNQHDPLSIYKKYSFDEIKTFFSQWFSPEDTENVDVEDEKAVPSEEEVVETAVEDIDDLPFVPDPPVVTPPVEEKVIEVKKESKAPAKSKAGKFKDLFDTPKK